MKNILIADDHPLFLDAIEHWLHSSKTEFLIHRATNYAEIKERIAEIADLNLLLADLIMPGMNGMEGIQQLKQSHPTLPLVIMSATENSNTIREALESGANGYIPKSHNSTDFLTAIGKVLTGGLYMPPSLWKKAEKSHQIKLSPRQYEVLDLMAEGHSNKEIGYRLELTEGTVKLHVTAILKALGVTNRTQAIKRARELYLIT